MFWILFVSFCIFLASLYIIARLTYGITKSPKCLLGKTAIITGANSGIGLETALNLASRGCRVIMADVADMTESKRKIIAKSENPNIVTKFLDLASFKSVRAFAEDIINTEPKVHILLNNAGIGVTTKEETEDGLSPVMQINHLGHFLLTHLLIELLKKSSSRIVFTCSLLAFTHNLNVKNVNNIAAKASQFSHLVSYSNSKLCTLIASDIFAKSLQGTGVTSNAIHPGLVYTKIFDPLGLKYKAAIVLDHFKSMFLWVFGKTPWEGAQTLTHCAVSEDLNGVTGLFYSDCRPHFKPTLASNTDFCGRVWRLSEELVGLKDTEKLPNVMFY